MEPIDWALGLYDIISLAIVLATAAGSLLWDLARSWGHPKGGPSYVLKRLSAHVAYVVALLVGLGALFFLFAKLATVDGAVPGFAIAIAMLAWALFCTLWLLRISPRLTQLPPRFSAWPSRDDLYLALSFSASLLVLLAWRVMHL